MIPVVSNIEKAETEKAKEVKRFIRHTLRLCKQAVVWISRGALGRGSSRCSVSLLEALGSYLKG